ncbi:MAG: hypothetical protein LBJ00_15260 [Planctomycetaceae bacterium]|jgi:hypothetical protein|nr:hypothetical protein [Planctomycetaceae bacterium]
MSLNQLPTNPASITYEQIMVIIHETSLIVKDLAERSKETKKSMAESAEQLQKMEKSVQEYIEQSKYRRKSGNKNKTSSRISRRKTSFADNKS